MKLIMEFRKNVVCVNKAHGNETCNIRVLIAHIHCVLHDVNFVYCHLLGQCCSSLGVLVYSACQFQKLFYESVESLYLQIIRTCTKLLFKTNVKLITCGEAMKVKFECYVCSFYVNYMCAQYLYIKYIVLILLTVLFYKMYVNCCRVV